MKWTTLTALAVGLAPVTASPVDIQVTPRALPNAPSGYTPKNVTCPATRPSIRSASSLSSNETEWLKTRRQETIQPLKDLLNHLDISGFDANTYIDNHKSNVSNIPNIAIAASGGGYRAMLNGAGAIKAFDSRIYNATTKGHLGGVLQAATYVAGLSGGSWLVGSIYINNFTTISDLQTYEKGAVWQLSKNIFEGPDTGGIRLFSEASYYKDLYDAVEGKTDAGFKGSLTDYWGRALSYQFINDSNGGIDYTWSSIAETEDFKAAKMPMPLVVADGRGQGELIIGSNSTVYEFNPWEFGSFDPTVYGFAPLEYVGSKFEKGELPDNATCVRGFDNAGYIMGTSSTLFNQGMLVLDNSSAVPDFLKSGVEKILTAFDDHDDDIAVYSPNPFYRYRDASTAYAGAPDLDVVDGGEDNQNVPLHPVIQPERHVDVVFAIDSSADTDYSWPNGASLVATYERSLNSTGIGNGTAFPSVPGQNTFINLGLNTRPTFFGCDPANITGEAPLVVYLPNYPYTFYSNTSTYKMTYSDEERDNMITNGYEVVTRGNGTEDSKWPTCVGCAIISRSLNRTNTAVPEVCNQCFQQYCWNGTVDNSDPGDYEPTSLMTVASGSSKSQFNRTAAFIAFAVAIFATV
ncbi:hypothetical protein ASPWEDRAFT_37916 [Aspergillus wentii DTO 134E9]|uniref:Lysophospholipase n=1 Tax=Aspergillus wentii DTO 134E9 TaxID=1073089 RepID=A0A1L9RN69_ASPWE|nr:uncharacterized protein ASPWEDRAFT_37916 [Aspergillus wentii DTO 134E9]KAI9926012.1 Lysophospholipase 1 [Aspergillus wentii]OJJ36352.1 hypothetical protein ASPWEDRAFT_37916 [Aspergillus wentii DTO 134E9]